MEKPMKKQRLPRTDSINKLAEFWESHDLTDFEADLEEVTERVFASGSAIKVPLETREVQAVKKMAKAKGVSLEQLVRTWVVQQVARRNNGRTTKR
jgi:predicted DNA binding CopG/RHH family protein